MPSLLLSSSCVFFLGSWSVSYFQLLSLKIIHIDTGLDFIRGHWAFSHHVQLHIAKPNQTVPFPSSVIALVLITWVQNHWLFLYIHISMCLSVATATLFWIVSRSREYKEGIFNQVSPNMLSKWTEGKKVMFLRLWWKTQMIGFWLNGTEKALFQGRRNPYIPWLETYVTS